jgi:signal transduction histidine kinase
VRARLSDRSRLQAVGDRSSRRASSARPSPSLKESKEHRHQLSVQLLAAGETERRRIATELHDGFGHALILMRLRVGAIERELKRDATAAAAGCQNLVQLIDMAIDDIRRLARDLRPSVLEEMGLSAALNWLLDNCIPRDHTMVSASVVHVDDLVAPDAQVVLYRIVQEALTNVAKHSQATHVSLRGNRRGHRLSFVVEDNGKGFDGTGALTGPAFGRGLGLAIMHERARMIGSSLTVWSEPQKGTRIAFDVPVWSPEG